MGGSSSGGKNLSGNREVAGSILWLCLAMRRGVPEQDDLTLTAAFGCYLAWLAPPSVYEWANVRQL